MDTRARKALARSNSTVGRRNFDDPQQSSIRFDYSSIYFDNDELDDELEYKKRFIHRAQQKASIDSEVNLLAAKKDAEEMLSLKEKIQNRDKNESSRKVLKSAEHCKRKGKGDTRRRTSLDPQEKDGTSEKHRNIDEVDSLSTTTASSDFQSAQSTQRKPLNTLTMYLLAVQDFKRGCLRKDEDRKEKRDKKDDIQALPIPGLTRPSTQPGLKSSKRPTSFRGGSVRPATAHVIRRRTSELDNDDGNGEQAAYGIHVKTDFTRSRRKLEEISKLEQDAKFGYVNKYEQRRQRLLASCKDTEVLDLRVQRFLKNVEDFNELNTPKNSLDRILMRSKSATYRRDNHFA